MATQTAVEIIGPRDAQLTTHRPKPSLRNDYILVKTVAVALNPTDWKHIDLMPTAGALSGCDYAGVVEEVGTKVDKPFKKGDRVFGCCHGANALQLEDGAFAEYIVAKGSVQMAIPEHLTFEAAATLGVAIVTVGQALYQSLQLPLPSAAPAKEPFPVLIYGGSTATGTVAIQFAKLSGATVITTCSPRNNKLVKALGADAVFDYRDEACGEKIRDYTSNKLMHALDCVAEASSPQICADALSTDGAHTKQYSSLDLKDFPRDDVEKKATLGYSAIGEEMSFPGQGTIPAKEEDLQFMIMFTGIAQELLAEGKIKPHPAGLRQGGLKGVLDGLQEMREGKVSGEKLVYRVDETP